MHKSANTTGAAGGGIDERCKRDAVALAAESGAVRSVEVGPTEARHESPKRGQATVQLPE